MSRRRSESGTKTVEKPVSNSSNTLIPDGDPVRDRFFATGDARQVLRDKSAYVDGVVKAAYAEHLAPVYPANFAALAVGGYGRRELFPHSDIDVLLLSAAVPTTTERAGISAFLQAIWDAGLRLSHSVRDVKECVELHEQNIELNISLLDRRFLAGDAALWDELESRMPKFLTGQRQALMRHLCKMTRQRHAKFHDTIYHLEPNIKEGPGGMRDLHVLAWLRQLAGDGGSDSPWINPVDEPREFLHTLRCFLHYRSNRDNNLLNFEAQEEFTELPFVDAGIRAAASRGEAAGRWMREYFRNARAIQRETVRTLEAHEGAGSGLLAGFRDWRSRLSNSDFTVARERVLFKSPHSMESDPDLAMRLFQFVARHGIPLHRESERRLREHRAAWERHFSGGPHLWPAVKTLLQSKFCATALGTMHENGALNVLFPEFAEVECEVIRDFNHRYTVDEHTLIAIQNLEDLAASQDPGRERFALLLQEAPDMVSLRLALLFHDVGKADESNESHTTSSARQARQALERIHAPADVIELVAFLIEHHLLLSAAMAGRDLEDPSTAFDLAHRIGTVERLKELTLLTYADIGAVHPSALSPWRLSQLWRVYSVTHRELTRELDAERIEMPAAESPEQREFLAGFPTRYLRTHTEDQIRTHLQLDELRRTAGSAVDIQRRNGVYELSLLTSDRLFLFASVAGTLASFGMNILKAEAFANRHGVVLDTFMFEDPQRTLELNPTEMDRLKLTLDRVLNGRVTVRELLRNRPKPAAPSKGGQVPPRVGFDNTASQTSTLVEVVAEDRPGLLFDLANVFSEGGCSIDVVLVDTEAHKAIDVFYVTADGGKLDDDAMPPLKDALLAACRG
jgi:[protein-PII] uridylyltransferase